VDTKTKHGIYETSDMVDISKEVDMAIETQSSQRREESFFTKTTSNQHTKETTSLASPSMSSKRRMSSIVNPDYYNYAWRTIRDHTEEVQDGDDAIYW
jgi:hypothetical protein